MVRRITKATPYTAGSISPVMLLRRHVERRARLDLQTENRAHCCINPAHFIKTEESDPLTESAGFDRCGLLGQDPSTDAADRNLGPKTGWTS